MSAASLPSAPPITPCPGCGGVMGDGDRVTYGRCPLCRTAGRTARGLGRLRGRCWCGRGISATARLEAFECAEHDGPIPETAQAPSDPTTPGGVFDRLYP